MSSRVSVSECRPLSEQLAPARREIMHYPSVARGLFEPAAAFTEPLVADADPCPLVCANAGMLERALQSTNRRAPRSVAEWITFVSPVARGVSVAVDDVPTSPQLGDAHLECSSHTRTARTFTLATTWPIGHILRWVVSARARYEPEQTQRHT